MQWAKDNKNSTHTYKNRKEREKERKPKSIVCESVACMYQSPIDDDFKFKHNKLRVFLIDCLIMIIGKLADGITIFVHSIR